MKKIIVIALVLMLAIFVIACDSGNSDLTKQRNDSVDKRVDTMNRAEASHPTPYTENFPLRQLLVEYTNRTDMLNHPWYNYIMAENGQITHYFVSASIPVSTNAFLGSTESIYRSDDGTVVVAAPSLDGIYYGGGGSIGSDNGWIFKDSTTGAILVIHCYTGTLISVDAPLMLETEPMLMKISQ